MQRTFKNVLLSITLIMFICFTFSLQGEILRSEELRKVQTIDLQTPVLVTAGYGILERNTIISPSYILKQQPSNIKNVGLPQEFSSLWEKPNFYYNLGNASEFKINEEGLLYKQCVNITELEAEPIILSVEDYNPSLASNFDYIYSDEISYMGFTINGTQPVVINGFWIYLRGESRGIMRYQVYQAMPGFESLTFPDTMHPVSPQYDEPVSPIIENGQEKWVWMSLEGETLTVDPTTTFSNIFYLGIWRAFDDATRLRWVYCNDNTSPDNEDEGDCYGYFSGFTYRTRDLFLNISISPISSIPFPSTINMKINNNSISNQINPGMGFWDSGRLNPAINTSFSPQNYKITCNWSDFYQWPVSYNLLWNGYFYKNDLASTEYQVWLSQSTSLWKISFPIDYPITSENQILNVSLENEWTVVTVRKNTVLHTNWTEYDSYLVIGETNDGIWEIECSAPNYIFDVNFLNSQNENITEANDDDLIRICCNIKDTKGNLVLNGKCNLTVFDPEDLQEMQVLNKPISIDSDYNVVFNWDLRTLDKISGFYTINLTWTNGTAVGMTSSSILVTIPVPPLAKMSPYLILFSVIILTVFGSSVIIRYFVTVPKKQAYYEHLLRLKNIFTDAIQLKRLLIIHKQSGLCFLDPLSEESIDANLMGGLLQAISAFGGSLVGTAVSSREFGNNVELKGVTYGDNHIVIFDGNFIRTAAIFSGIPSTHINIKLEKFTELFEENHLNELRNWTGNLDKIADAADIIEEIFTISLNYEHKFSKIETEVIELNGLRERVQDVLIKMQDFIVRKQKEKNIILLNKAEKKLHNFIVESQDGNDIVKINSIIDEFMKNSKKDDLEVYEAIFTLRDKEILVPITNYS